MEIAMKRVKPVTGWFIYTEVEETEVLFTMRPSGLRLLILVFYILLHKN